MSLQNKSIHELRAIATSFDIVNVFAKTADKLISEIDAKQKDMIPISEVVIPRPEYDARLMTKIPSRLSQPHDIDVMLKEHQARGLDVTFDEERWYMRMGEKTDEGSLRMPLRNVMTCAENIMKK